MAATQDELDTRAETAPANAVTPAGLGTDEKAATQDELDTRADFSTDKCAQEVAGRADIAGARETMGTSNDTSPHEEALEAVTAREDAPARHVASPHEAAPARDVAFSHEEAIVVCGDAPIEAITEGEDAIAREKALEAITRTRETVQMLSARGWRAPWRALDDIQHTARDDANARTAVGAVAPLLRHRRWRVRAAAGRALQQCAAASEGGRAAVEELARAGQAPAAFSALVRALPHAAQGVKQHLRAAHVARDLLQTESPRAREVAVDGLALVGGGAEIKRLLEERALSDSSWTVRMAAVSASVQLANRFVGQAVGEAALQLIGGRTEDSQAAVREEAARGLVALSAALPASVTKPKPVVQAITGYSTYGMMIPRAPQQDHSWMGRVCECLIARLADESVHVRRTTAKLLRSLPAASVPRKALSQHLQSSDWWLWSAAVLAYLPGAPPEDRIWSILADARQQTKGAALMRVIVRESEELRTAAAARLNVPSPLEKQHEQIKDALKCLEDLSWRERGFAIEILSTAVEQGSGDAITGAIEKLSHGSSRVCIAAADVLAHMSRNVPSELSVRAVQHMLELFDHPVSDVRAKGAATLSAAARKGGISDSAVEAIVRVIVDGSRHNMRRASHALTSMVEAPGYGSRLAEVTTRHLLKGLQKAGSVNAIEVVLNTLSQVAPRNHLDAQTSLHRIAVEDSSPAIRLAALDALGAIATSAGSELRGAVQQCVEDPDDVVREVALEMQVHLQEDAATRQREICLELLQELDVAFTSPQIQQRLWQLWKVHGGRESHHLFRLQRRELFFEVHRTVLPKYHFEGTREGVHVMEQVCQHMSRNDNEIEEKMAGVYQLMGLPPPEALQGRSAHRAARVAQMWSASLHKGVRGGPQGVAAAPGTAATWLESSDIEEAQGGEGEDVSSSPNSASEGVPELEDGEAAGDVLSGQE